MNTMGLAVDAILRRMWVLARTAWHWKRIKAVA